MSTTLYEILEVSESASQEIIEKAYKVLAKKYHPDLQTESNKAFAEQKMKQINEAYAILGDEEKRKEYDAKLASERQVKNQANNQVNNQPTDFSYSHTMSQEERRYKDMQRRRYDEELRRRQEQIEKNMKKQYENAYYSYLKNLGFKIKQKWTWEKTKHLLLTIFILILIGIILWIIPPTHNVMLKIYQENVFVNIVVNVIVSIVKAFFETIKNIFTSFFPK